MFKTKIVSEISEFYQLENTWRLISGNDSRSQLFTSFEWIENWIYHYWTVDYSLNIVIVKVDKKPVAILPLYTNLQSRKNTLLGTGEPEHHEVSSEYLDFLIDIDDDAKDELYKLIANYLTSNLKYPLTLTNCLKSSHAMKISEKCKNVTRTVTGKEFKIDLTKSFEDIFSDFSKNHRKKSREILNQSRQCN